MKEGKYSIALQQYLRVVRLLDGYFNSEEKDKRDPLLLVGHLNLAACHLKLNNNFKCIKECEKVSVFPTWPMVQTLPIILCNEMT